MEVQKSRAGALRDVVFRGCLCFTVSAVLYTAVMSLMLADSAGEPAAVFTLLFQNFLIILAASAVFGASFLIFDAKGLPSAAKRTLHVVLLYATMLGAFLLMADVSAGEVGTKVLFVFLSTLLFIVFYAVGCLLASLVRRYKTR